MSDFASFGLGIVLIYLIGWIIGALIAGLIGQWVGSMKGNGQDGFWLSFVLGLFFIGFLGWILIAMQPDNREFVEVPDYNSRH